MKINNLGPSGLNPYKRQMNSLENVERSTSKKKTDKVEISAAAKDLQYTSSIETERQIKVDELKNEVESGNYQINPDQLAKSIIQFYKK
jgi:negative regulator of flagellin synthesis FlgM